jgi:two-component system, NarL family, response regulator NreC
VLAEEHSLFNGMSARILLADDHVMVRQALRSVLEKEAFEVISEASDGREAVHQCGLLKPDVAVLDITMPLLNGVDAAREILRVLPECKVILVTMHTQESIVLEALRAGVQGYVLKTNRLGELVDAIRDVLRGHTYLSPGISRTVVQAYLSGHGNAPDRLSAREREVLQLVAEGKTTKEIAALLGISTNTAESHRNNIMAKLEIHDIAGLVRYAIRNGLSGN